MRRGQGAQRSQRAPRAQRARRAPRSQRARRARAVAVAGLVGVLILGLAQPSYAAPGPSQAPEWWFDSWHVTSLWDSGARGQGMTIAEIDTGVNASLPELAGNVLPGKDYGAGGAARDQGHVDHAVDTFGHGTAMASIMVAHPGLMGITGLAPNAKILPIAVPLRGTNDEPSNGNDHLADAIRWAAGHGAKIISMSLGGARDPSDGVPCPDDEQTAINYAIGKGAVVLASSGNSGQMGSPVEEPGVCLGVVSVGAVDSHGNVPAFSSRHSYLTVTAPGVDIPSLGRVPGDAFVGDGTSQATALTAAAIALVWSKYPALTARQVVARMLATLDHRTGRQDPSYGYGIIDPYRAITTAVPADAPNPVYAGLAPFLTTPPPPRPLVAPKPAATRPVPPGTVAVGRAPGVWTSQVWAAFGVGLAGLLALIALAVLGTIRSRRHAALTLNRPWLAQAGPAAPAPTYRDETGMVWHDLTAPREER